MLKSSTVDRSIGARLFALRLFKGFDPPSFSEMVGISEARLARFETGIERIDAGAMLRICRALQADVAYFFQTDEINPRVHTNGVRLHIDPAEAEWICETPD